MKRKAELVDLCEKAAEMKQAKLEDTEDYIQQLLEEKLQTEDSKLPDPKTFTAWNNSFRISWSLRFEICTAIWREERNIPAEENLRSFN